MDCEHIKAKDNIQVMLLEKQHSLAVNSELEGSLLWFTPTVRQRRLVVTRQMSTKDRADLLSVLPLRFVLLSIRCLL